jgi:hypothetical protein
VEKGKGEKVLQPDNQSNFFTFSHFHFFTLFILLFFSESAQFFRMMTVEQIQDILSIYQKHGWTLRRVLLSASLKKHLAGFNFEAETVESEIDAAWFSRPSGEKEAWELRRLNQTPFALFETFDEEDEEEVREEIRREMEARLR